MAKSIVIKMQLRKTPKPGNNKNNNNNKVYRLPTKRTTSQADGHTDERTHMLLWLYAAMSIHIPGIQFNGFKGFMINYTM